MKHQENQILEAVKGDDVLALSRLGVDTKWANQWRDDNGRGLLHHAVHNQAGIALQWMLDHWDMGVDPRDNQDETPLMRAAWLGDTQSMETLIDAGANINAQARTGGTALHYAYGGGHQDAVDRLGGADAGILDASGRSAKEWQSQAKSMELGSQTLAKLKGERTPRRGVLKLGSK